MDRYMDFGARHIAQRQYRDDLIEGIRNDYRQTQQRRQPQNGSSQNRVSSQSRNRANAAAPLSRAERDYVRLNLQRIGYDPHDPRLDNLYELGRANQYNQNLRSQTVDARVAPALPLVQPQNRVPSAALDENRRLRSPIISGAPAGNINHVDRTRRSVTENGHESPLVRSRSRVPSALIDENLLAPPVDAPVAPASPIAQPPNRLPSAVLDEIRRLRYSPVAPAGNINNVDQNRRSVNNNGREPANLPAPPRQGDDNNLNYVTVSLPFQLAIEAKLESINARKAQRQANEIQIEIEEAELQAMLDEGDRMRQAGVALNEQDDFWANQVENEFVFRLPRHTRPRGISAIWQENHPGWRDGRYIEPPQQESPRPRIQSAPPHHQASAASSKSAIFGGRRSRHESF